MNIGYVSCLVRRRLWGVFLTGAIALTGSWTIAVPPPAGDDTEALLAFPEAEGFGACTPGGRGGKIYFVTTLEDYLEGFETPIPGSLRAAVSAQGPRIVIFRVSGIIALKCPLNIRYPYLTIAGQTAPGDGVCVSNYRTILRTHDVIIRHMRFRLGDPAQSEQITLHVISGQDIILDHCSVSWAVDENLTSTKQSGNITVQWCIVSEGLSRSYHPKGEHSKGSLLGGIGGMTFHHNIYAHNGERNPRLGALVLDFRNNVVYDWGAIACHTRCGPCYLNLVGNYFKPGPSTFPDARTNVFRVGDALHPDDDMARVFLSGNLLFGCPRQTQDNTGLVHLGDESNRDNRLGKVIVRRAFPCPRARTDTAEAAFDRVLASCGATLPKRDQADRRLIEEIRTGGGRIIDSQDDVGGWPILSSIAPAADSDSDAMPDEWETAHGLAPYNPADTNGDPDGDGYTNIEEYLNSTDPYAAEPNCRVSAQEFRQAREQAANLSQEGKRLWDQTRLSDQGREEGRKQEIIKSLKIAVEPREGPDVRRIIVKFPNGIDMEMVLIPSGSFLMGSPDSEGGTDLERPQHKVNISRAFYMAATPVTEAQFQTVLGDPNKAGKSDLPVAVSWYKAVEFCEVLSAVTGRRFRLPTEAQWEYACRAGTTTAFNTGDTITTEQANFNGLKTTPFNPVGVCRDGVTPVRMFPPNAWGLYDMHGNEAEYCLDNSFRIYDDQEITDPVGPEKGENKVLRGGKNSSKAFFIRSAFRYYYAPDVEYGFRPVMELGK